MNKGIKSIIILVSCIFVPITITGCMTSPLDDRQQDIIIEDNSVLDTAEQATIIATEEIEMFNNLQIQLGKEYYHANPLVTHIYCADPTAVEYEGRLYVYGTNDHQQYLHDVEGNNTYEKIKSLVMLSTDDMVNWTYHGTIETGKIAPWIIASWAPSITSRIEEDGKTHFYLYFSNSGWGTGVLTSTSPTGPWEDPLGKSLIDGNTKGLGDRLAAAFDPGVVTDDNGDSWLSFGGSSSGDDADENYIPGGARIVKLGDDMISLASDIMEIPAPYHFEANELNYINGTYVYTYCNSWVSRDRWEIDDAPKPTAASMSYMTTSTPLDPDSWVYRGHYFKNPGDNGLSHSNNHTHLHKYQGQHYLFYHTLELQKKNLVKGGFRNISVDTIELDEETYVINKKIPTSRGVEQIKSVDPYNNKLFSTHASSATVSFEAMDAEGNMFVSSDKEGSWILVRGVDFSDGANGFTTRVKGTGRIEIRLDDIKTAPIGYIDFSVSDWEEKSIELSESINGVHDVFFVFTSEDINAYSWCFQ